jgi:hypothetical protein
MYCEGCPFLSPELYGKRVYTIPVFCYTSNFSFLYQEHFSSGMVEKSRRKLISLADGLSDVYGHQQWGNQWHLFKLTHHWPQLVGEAFAEHSMPAYFRRKELWVYAHNSLWMQQMHFSSTDIIAKINVFLRGALTVEDLRWALQPAELIDTPEEKYVPPPLDVDSDAERQFRSMAENVANPEAREALCRLWKRMESLKKK